MIFTKASLLLVVGLANNFNSVNGAVIPGGLLPDDLQDATDVVTDTTFTTISGKSLGRDDKEGCAPKTSYQCVALIRLVTHGAFIPFI